MGLHAVNSFSLAIRPGLLVSGSSELLETAFSGHMLMIASQFPLSLQNIVLIRDPEDSRKFYPRFNLEDTSSFKDLDEHRYFYHAILHEPVVFFFQCSQEQISIHWKAQMNKVIQPSPPPPFPNRGSCVSFSTAFKIFFSWFLISYKIWHHTFNLLCGNLFVTDSSLIQQKCSQKVVLWLLFLPARNSLASKCTEDSACPIELIRYVGLWRGSWPYSFLCSSSMFSCQFSPILNLWTT